MSDMYECRLYCNKFVIKKSDFKKIIYCMMLFMEYFRKEKILEMKDWFVVIKGVGGGREMWVWFKIVIGIIYSNIECLGFLLYI